MNLQNIKELYETRKKELYETVKKQAKILYVLPVILCICLEISQNQSWYILSALPIIQIVASILNHINLPQEQMNLTEIKIKVQELWKLFVNDKAYYLGLGLVLLVVICLTSNVLILYLDINISSLHSYFLYIFSFSFLLRFFINLLESLLSYDLIFLIINPLYVPFEAFFNTICDTKLNNIPFIMIGSVCAYCFKLYFLAALLNKVNGILGKILEFLPILVNKIKGLNLTRITNFFVLNKSNIIKLNWFRINFSCLSVNNSIILGNRLCSSVGPFHPTVATLPGSSLSPYLPADEPRPFISRKASYRATMFLNDIGEDATFFGRSISIKSFLNQLRSKGVFRYPDIRVNFLDVRYVSVGAGSEGRGSYNVVFLTRNSELTTQLLIASRQYHEVTFRFAGEHVRQRAFGFIVPPDADTAEYTFEGPRHHRLRWLPCVFPRENNSNILITSGNNVVESSQNVFTCRILYDQTRNYAEDVIRV